MKNTKKIGLALSGGGYRAAAFHLGTFKKLNQLNILNNIDVISCISGGSIAGAYYLLHKDQFKAFENEFTTALERGTINKIIFSYQFIVKLILILFLCAAILYLIPLGTSIPLTIILIIVIIFNNHTVFSFTSLKQNAYDKIFFRGKKLANLPGKPKAAINATNLETATLFTFSKEKTSDSSYQYPKDGTSPIEFDCSTMPISMAVASSTTVPGIFNPVTIQKKYFKNLQDYKKINPALVDGGVYDNQGIHKLTQKNSSYACEIVICSDGSMPFKFKFSSYNFIKVLFRANDIMMRKIKSMQFIRDVYFSQEGEIAYFSLDWRYNNSIDSLVQALGENKIKSELLQYYNIPETILSTTGKIFKPDEIKNYLKSLIKYDSIVQTGLTAIEITEISNIGTNLTALTKRQISLLSKHAEVLTELHILLYCPGLIHFFDEN